MTPEPSPRDVIRITPEEARSKHVDNLLQRQMNMRGEHGMARGYRRAWYYQNWFIFMVAGLCASLLGWAAIEPFLQDLIYCQGIISNVERDPTAPVITFRRPTLDKGTTPFSSSWVEVGEDRILVGENTRLTGSVAVAQDSPPVLAKGNEVGLYCLVVPLDAHDYLAVAAYMDPSPPPGMRRKGSVGLLKGHRRSETAHNLLFPVMAGLVGLAIGGVDGLVCRALRRALIGAVIGLFVGVVGGFISSAIAHLVYLSINVFAGGDLHSWIPFGFSLQMTRRGIAWALAGMTMGLGHGIALRSKRLTLYGFLGGVIGGLLGGLFFDPIDMLLLGGNRPSAHWSRLVGFLIIGATVGAMIGLVELFSRDAWLRMVKGPLAGKEFLLFKDHMKIGASPRSDIYLFNDKSVRQHHATLRALGDEVEIVGAADECSLMVNGMPVHQARLRHGDAITVGSAVFVYETRN